MFLLLWVVVENKPHLFLMIWISAKLKKLEVRNGLQLLHVITFRIVPCFGQTKLNPSIAHLATSIYQFIFPLFLKLFNDLTKGDSTHPFNI